MATIDTSKIPGFEEMSAEEKIAALTAYEFEVPEQKEKDSDMARLKAALSKANSEAADWKRQLRDKQTEAEREAAERAEHDAARDEELKTLRRDRDVSNYLAQYIALGYSRELAQKAAEATADGDSATIMTCQQSFIEAKTKEIEAAALDKQPGLSHGAPPTSTQAEVEEKNLLRSYFGLPPIK